MGRTKKTPFPAWDSCKADGIEKRYFRWGATKAAAMIGLSDAAFRILMCMHMESGGKQTFQFPYSKYHAYASKPKFLRARKELLSNGFIEIAENNANIRRPNLYRFSTQWKVIKKP